MKFFITILLACMGILSADAQKTEIKYLSGHGPEDAVEWDFWCSDGMNARKWSKISVPSCWEQQGFGGYTYGRYYIYDRKDNAKYKDYREHAFTDEYGIYRHRFSVPKDWQGRQVSIVFDGVMTDADVTINGQKAGDVHQGAFYRFKYDISDLIKYGGRNTLEVTVKKQSDDKSVNNAERRADWWLFGGIYRPVYIEAKPTARIDHVAIDAKADGKLNAHLALKNIHEGTTLELQLLDDKTNAVIGKKTVQLDTAERQAVATEWKGVRPWDTEHPNLYRLSLRLRSSDGRTLHETTERIGFRTIEFKPQDGIYLNGTKLLIKGTNRHCFSPETGRTISYDLSLKDAKLIKGMNMNAVRSHYPPDVAFLDICDSLGLLYLDELTGWQMSYSTETGSKLLKEMIERDINHPCIFLWSNGNEGGWNTRLDSLFAEYDPQHRHVVHPWADFNGLDTRHYPTAQDQAYRLERGQKVFMMTEFLHGLYDRGQGAGLEGLWRKFRQSPLFAGGFIWAYVDEALHRTDTGKMDTYGPNAPDGIVSAERQKLGSYNTVREVWSPIQIKPFEANGSFKGDFLVENGFLFSSLSEASMQWKIWRLPAPSSSAQPSDMAHGSVTLPHLQPGETGRAHIHLPEKWRDGDVLQLQAYGISGDTLCTWTYPIKRNAQYFAENRPPRQSKTAASFAEENGQVKLTGHTICATFNKEDGSLIQISKAGADMPMKHGPIAEGMEMKTRSSCLFMQGDTAVFVVKYDGAVDSIVWRMTPDGLLGMESRLLNWRGKNYDISDVLNFGLSFDYDEHQVKGMRWMGKGPYRVWKNRVKGTNYGIWQKDYNNTVTSEYYHPQIYPEFKGYHANLYWATLESATAPMTVYCETDGIFMKVFTPEEQRDREGRGLSVKEYSKGDLSFLLEIPAVNSQGADGGPSIIRVKKGDEGYAIRLWFHF